MKEPPTGGATWSLFDLSGRTAIVTGASGALGQAFCRGLHSAGANVVAVARRGDRLDALTDELGSRAMAFVGDVTSAPDRRAVVDAATTRWGRISILVNNAGVIEAPKDASDTTLEEFAHVIDVNLTGLFGLTQLVGLHMKGHGGGSIVNIGSIHGLVAMSGGASYSASKGAIHALTKELAIQWAPDGIRVNSLSPGYFWSEMTQDWLESDLGQRMVRRMVPSQRPGRADELVGALIFLSSDASSYCTGHVLVIDGGYTAK